jgi:hypothetical protein
MMVQQVHGCDWTMDEVGRIAARLDNLPLTLKMNDGFSETTAAAAQALCSGHI